MSKNIIPKAANKGSKPSVIEYKSYPVQIKIISQKGTCAFNHKTGDEWIYKYEPGPGKKPETPDICDAALHVLQYYLKPMWWGAIPPCPTPDPDTFFCACPDPINPVVFELKRLKDQPSILQFPVELDVYKDRDGVNTSLKKEGKSAAKPTRKKPVKK